MNIKLVSILTFVSIATIFGCKSNNTYVIHNDNVVTNNVPMKAFNDENYIWESWTFSTNEVKNIDK